MENKVIFEGVICNEIKLSQYNTTLLRLQNKREFTKKDGSAGSSSCTVVVSLRDKVALIASERFKRGDIVRVEGSLMLKKTDKMDQEGREIWETWISGWTVNALANMGSVDAFLMPKKPIAERTGYKPTLPTQAPQRRSGHQGQPHKPSSFDQQPLPIQTEDPNQIFEEIFDDTTLLF